MSPAAVPRPPDPGALMTMVIHHLVERASVPAYERWLSGMLGALRDAPGHRCANVSRPASGAGEYTIVARFDDAAHLQAWLHSARRRALLAEVQPLLIKDRRMVQHDAAFWFAPPVHGVRLPSRWKQFVLALVVIYPLWLLASAAVARLEQHVPLLRHAALGMLVVAMAVLALVVYVAMPLLTRALARWLAH